MREEAEETFFTFYTYLHVLTLGNPVCRLHRVSHTPRGGLDPELWGSPNLGAFIRRKDHAGIPPCPPPPAGFEKSQRMRKPHSSSVNLESWSADTHAAPHPRPLFQEVGELNPFQSGPPPAAPCPLASPLGRHSLPLLGSRGEGCSGCCPLPPPPKCRSPCGLSCHLGIPRRPVGHCCPQLGSWVHAVVSRYKVRSQNEWKLLG